MEILDFKTIAKEYQNAGITDSDWARISLQNRVTAYNAMVAPDDGSGVTCPQCRGKGTVAVVSPHSGNFTILPCRCHGTRLTVKRLQKCGVWKQAQRYTLDNFHTDTVVQKTMKSVTQQFLEQPKGHWLMLCGQSGSGKTHLCTAAFVQLTHKLGLAGEYFLWNRDGRRLKAAVLEDNQGVWERYKETELLYIDDLFKDAASDADKRMAFELLDYRYNNDLLTILSSELSLDQRLALDEAIAGHIREKCGPYLVNIGLNPEKNYRLSNQAG